MWSSRRALASAANRSAQRVAVRSKSTQLVVPRTVFSRSLAAASARSFSNRLPQTTPIVQALALDRFGRHHRVEIKAPTSDATDVLLMAKWAAALLATGACLAGAVGEGSQAHAAPASGSSDSNTEDLLEQLKKKVKAIANDSLGNLEGLLPAHLEGVQQQINDFLASGKGGQISWGFMMGACSGFALKKVSKLGAIALGSVFIMFQCASYAGYINVNHKKIEKDVLDVLDINRDGQFDSKDVDEVYKQVMKVLEYSMPAGSGFAVGFLVGFRAG